MSVVTRLVLLATSVGALLIGAWGWTLLESEEDQLRTAERDEMSLVGRAVSIAAVNALRDKQLNDVVETISGLAVVDPDLDVQLFGPDGALVAQAEGDPLPDATSRNLVERATNEGRTAVRWFPPSDPIVLLLAEPLKDDAGGLLGVVVVRRPLLEMRAHLAATRQAILETMVVFVFVAGVTIWLSARATIGAPLDVLVEAIRAVQRADLGVRLDQRRADELGGIARAWNEMADALGEARERLATEQEQRREQQLAMARADKLATLGQMTATIAHEVASPLQAVLGHAEQVIERADDPERVRRHGEVVLKHTRRVIDVLRRMLEFARRPVGEGHRYRVRPIVDDVLELANLEARRRGVEVAVRDEGAPDVVGDPSELQQVLLNLVRNAVAASGPGKRVTVVLRSDRVPVAPGVPEDVLALEVHDEGEGLPDGDPEHLFDPFVSYRGEGGTGLGLAVVRGLVQARGGLVRAERLDAGSRFLVVLPAAGAPLDA
jgi:signal transduction histidine kinase